MVRLSSVVFAFSMAGCAAALAAPAPPVLDRKSVESFADSQVLPALKGSGVPGAVVVVVRRGEAVLVKGYGLADVKKRTPVDGAKTLFDIASIGKTMTTIATLQLIDEGRLDLDTDVNRYLKSASVSGPKVTLRMLLAHRGGFDSDLTGLFVPFDGNPAMSRAELTRRLRPIAEPGRVTAYDNQGFGVVGLVLQDVAEMPLGQIFQQRLFQPLGMSNAVLGRPADGDRRLARCYVVHGPGDIDPCEYWLYREGIFGAGGIAASGADMARYMRMILNGGELDGHRVLSERAFADLTNFDDYRFNPGMPGEGRTFVQFEEFRGLEFAHGGSMPGFSSLMTVYADADVGIFVSFLGGQLPSYDARLSNLVQDWQASRMDPGAGRALLGLELFTKHFADRFIPAVWPRSSTGKTQSPEGPVETTSMLPGEYYPVEHESRTLSVRMAGWLSGIEVSQAGTNSLTVADAGPYREIGRNLFESAERTRIAFTRLGDDQFMAVHLSPGVFQRKNVLQEPGWSLFAFPLLSLVVLSGLPNLRRGVPSSLRRLAGWSLCGLAMLFIALCCELQFARTFMMADGDYILPFLWRFAGLCGAAALLWASAGYLSRINRRDGIWRAFHGASIALSAVVLAFIWGLWIVPIMVAAG